MWLNLCERMLSIIEVFGRFFNAIKPLVSRKNHMDEAHQNVNAADESKNHFVGKAGEKEYIYISVYGSSSI